MLDLEPLIIDDGVEGLGPERARLLRVLLREPQPAFLVLRVQQDFLGEGAELLPTLLEAAGNGPGGRRARGATEGWCGKGQRVPGKPESLRRNPSAGVHTGKPPGVNYHPPLSESDRGGLVVDT